GDRTVGQGCHDPTLTGDIVGASALVAQRRATQHPARTAIDGDGEREVRPTDGHDFDIEVVDSESLLDPSADALCVESCRCLRHPRPSRVNNRSVELTVFKTSRGVKPWK